MEDFSRFLGTDPKFYALIDRGGTGNVDEFSIGYLVAKSVSILLIEDDDEHLALVRWLKQRGTIIVRSESEIDWSKTESEEFQPPMEFDELE